MITIITVCYNEEDTIGATMESVLGQDYEDFEYILKDGGSTDGTLEIIEEKMELFRSRGIPISLLTGPDRGLYDAMNTAVSQAGGEWINFLNAGDLFFNRTVLSDIFSGNSYEGVDLIYGDALEIEYGEYYYFKKCPELIKSRMPFNHQTVFASAALLREDPFELRLPIAADYNFLLKCNRKGKVFRDSGVLTAVISKDGVSSVRLKDTWLESMRIKRENGIVQPPEKEIEKELRLIGIKQFGMDHFPDSLKKMIRKVQRVKRKQPRIHVQKLPDGFFRLADGGRFD